MAAVRGAKVVAVLDANVSMGSEGAVGLDIKSKLIGRPGMPMVIDFIAGLGGREVNSSAVRNIVDRAEKISCFGRADFGSRMVGSEPGHRSLKGESHGQKANPES